MNDYICKYCGKSDFNSPKCYGAHITNCLFNPNRELIRQKQILASTKRKETKIKVCEKCNKEFSVYGTINQIKRSRKFCSHKCSYGKTHSIETKNKIRNSIKLKIDKIGLWGSVKKQHEQPHKQVIFDTRFCKSCGVEYTIRSNKKRKTCGNTECYLKFLSKQLKGKSGGPRKGGGFGKHSNYKMLSGDIFHCQSTIEYKMCQILDNLKLTWKRNIKGFPYKTIDGKDRKYYPDFYITDYDIYLETKGYLTTESIHKMTSSNIKNLIIIKTKKYGGDWENIIENNNLLINLLHNFNARVA